MYAKLKDLIHKKFFTRRFDPQMKVARIAWNHSKPTGMYVTSIPAFSWVGVSKEGVRPQVSEWMTCRESFAHHFREALEQNKVQVPKNRVCFMMGQCVNFQAKASVHANFQKRFLEEMKRGVKLVNLFEAYAGWTRTRLFAVSGLKEQHGAAYLITGPSRWLRSPQLFSLYCLLLRLGRFVQFDKVNTFRGFLEKCDEIVDKKLGGSNKSGDREWIRLTKKAWIPLIDHMDVIYKGRTLRRNWHKKYLTGSDNGFSEGIHRLVANTTADAALRKRWQNLTTSLAKKG